jgi:hypothetical protein
MDFIGIGVGIVFWITLTCLIPEMAKKRGRNVLGWFLLSFFLISPLMGVICLAFLGETEEKRKKRIMEEEELKELVRHKNSHQESKAERIFNPSAKTIGDMYKR